MVSFPYYSHIFRDSYGSGMGIVWETSHKGVPLLKVPKITLDFFAPNYYQSGCKETTDFFAFVLPQTKKMGPAKKRAKTPGKKEFLRSEILIGSIDHKRWGVKRANRYK